MLKIGLTGGIGSGKTTVAKVFEVLGIPVYNADMAAKRLMNEDAVLKEKIKQQFGDDVYKNEKLDNKYLAQIVFSYEEKLEILNSLVHPATINDANAWMLKHAVSGGQTTPYTLKEAALLFESGAADLLDYVIGVTAPAPLRLQRVMQRDNSSREEVMARMNKQMDEEIKMKLCNFIITNDEQQLLIPQVLALHETLLSLAANK
jgi:dephospho-CoA kinase